MLTTLLSACLIATLTLPSADDAAVIAEQAPLYPLDTCVVSGEPLGGMGEPVDVVQSGRLVRLCCGGCRKGLAKDPAGVLAKLDAAAMERQRPDYPLTTCLVSGEAFGGAMGEPIELIHHGRYVKVCCKGCLKGLDKDWTALRAKLDEATIAAQRTTYGLTSCPISDEPLGAGAQDVLIGTTLVRVCCSSCVKALRKAPAAALQAVRSARAKAVKTDREERAATTGAGAAAGRGGDGSRR